MGGVAQQAIELILARQLASGLAVPVLLVDASGDTLFFNEPAELIFGRRLDEIDALPFDSRTALLAPLSMDGEPIRPEELPGMVAMRNRRPAHAVFHVHGLDGVPRPVEATAIPARKHRRSRPRSDRRPLGAARSLRAARRGRVKLTIWGSRGSIASPGPETAR